MVLYVKAENAALSSAPDYLNHHSHVRERERESGEWMADITSYYLNHHSRLHTTSTITHTRGSTLPQPSLTLPQPSLTAPQSTLPQPSLNSTLPQPSLNSTLSQPSLTSYPPHDLNHHSRPILHTTSTITHVLSSTLPQPSLTTYPPH